MEGEEETEQTLNYDFNYNMIIAKTHISKLGLPKERQLATDWLQKLSTCGSAIEELRLRNLFAYFLLLSLQDGLLRPPFDVEPPASPLTSLEHLLPSEAYSYAEESGDERTPEDLDGDQSEGGGSRGRPPAYEFSPDGGEFLAAQPVPRCGAFCYLAVVARED